MGKAYDRGRSLAIRRASTVAKLLRCGQHVLGAKRTELHGR